MAELMQIQDAIWAVDSGMSKERAMY